LITVHIPNNFIPERTYAVRTLLTHYCRVPVEIIIGNQTKAYELKWHGKSITIADDFFGRIPQGRSYVDPAFLPQKFVQTASMGFENVLMLYGNEQLVISHNSIVCDVDLFAGVFFMLTRWEEAMGLHKDLHHRFPASEAAIVKAGFILRPVVDEYAALLMYWLKTLEYDVQSETSQYKVILSCDVDIPYYWRSKPVWKALGGRLLKHWNLISSVKEYAQYKDVKSNKKRDPYDTFDYLMDLAEKNGTTMQFNFIGGGKTRFEGNYHVVEPDIQALMKGMLGRGHTIGLHPSYDAYLDSSMIENEKRAVEASAGVSVTKSRQHYLRFAVPDTLGSLAAAGILEDSTLGYAAEPGFRCGTCKPFPVFDIEQREQLPLVEKPLLIMDVSFRMYKKLSIQESISLCEKIKSQVIKHNGELVILWHNSNLSEIDGWEGWKEVLEYLVGHFDSAQ
jgi:hypothetical protein